jgi:hypothetical protein
VIFLEFQPNHNLFFVSWLPTSTGSSWAS